MMEPSVIEKRFKVPHVYIILMAIIVVAGILTYIIPAGEYAMIEGPGGRMVVDPSSYAAVEQQPQNLFSMLKSIPKGMGEVAEIIFFIFIVGGAFAVIDATGAIEAGIGRVTQAFGKKPTVIIPIVMLLFAFGGSVFGMAEETIPFIPIMVVLAIALGYDSITGTAMVLAGAGAGFSGAFMNPFTIGVGQGIAELPLFSGMQFRLVVFALYVALTIGYVLWYGKKVRKNPKASSMYDVDINREDKLDLNNLKEFTTPRKLVLLVLALTIFLLIFGVIQYGWYIIEISALFLGAAIVVAIVGRLGLNGFAEHLVSGMSALAGGALVVGFARGILVVMTDGAIIHTILHSAATALAALPSMVSVLGMYVFQCALSYIVPSGSGQAGISLPILVPLGDLVGITRQTSVLIYQLADGISNIFTPTSGYFMAGLALAKIPWNKWAKWILPLIVAQYLLGVIILIIAQAIKFGPF